MGKQDIYDIDAELRAIITRAQADWDYADKHHTIPSPQTRSEVGSIVNYSQQIDALVAPLLEPAPSPTPAPAQNRVAPVPNGGILGHQKWYARIGPSTGVDIFVARGSPVAAPADCKVLEIIPGVGISGGAEFIVALLDGSEAWRMRHVQARNGLKVNYLASVGEDLGIVYDESLDQLCSPPVQNYPDGWQHADLSYNVGSIWFAPTGGGGGNRDAFTWTIGVGYQGHVVARTPGPIDCGLHAPAAVALMTPAGRR